MDALKEALQVHFSTPVLSVCLALLVHVIALNDTRCMLDKGIVCDAFQFSKYVFLPPTGLLCVFKALQNCITDTGEWLAK